MINKDTINGVYSPLDLTLKLQKERGVKHYQKELVELQLELLIESYQATGHHPCFINTKILIADLEEESGVNVTQAAINNFQEYLTHEILRAGDHD